jgi:hypothetical protein
MVFTAPAMVPMAMLTAFFAACLATIPKGFFF